MYSWIPFWPDTAASSGHAVNSLFAAELALSAVIMLTVVVMMLYFASRYRKGSYAPRADRVQKTWHFEIAWTAATLGMFLILFVYGAQIYVWLFRAPRGDEEIYVVGKQWMWKVQHPGGQREINELHIPADRAVRLIMSSQDVIHSFFVPAFRVKQDVVPGTSEELWFKPRKPGVFHLFCAEYCGTDHSRMTGRIIVMEPPAFAEWLTHQDTSGTLAAQGATIYRQFGCSGCHDANKSVQAPSLAGLYGKRVPVAGGTLEIADERYIRESILKPRAEIAAGYQAVMPSYEGKISEDELIKIVAYIKSIGDTGAPQ